MTDLSMTAGLNLGSQW